MMTTTRYEGTGASIAKFMRKHKLDKAIVVCKYLCRCTKTEVRDIEYFDTHSVFDYKYQTVQYDNGYAEVHVFVDYDYKCETCAPSIQYCDELPKPIGFDHRHYFHGVMAYNHCSIEESVQRVIGIKDNSSWQICCSTRPLGTWGVMVKGDVLAVSNIDLCSSIDEHGRRYYDARHWRANSMVYDVKDIDNTKWHHNEIVVRDHKITCLWVVEDAPTDVLNMVLCLAKELNVRCMFM